MAAEEVWVAAVADFGAAAPGLPLKVLLQLLPLQLLLLPRLPLLLALLLSLVDSPGDSVDGLGRTLVCICAHVVWCLLLLGPGPWTSAVDVWTAVALAAVSPVDAARGRRSGGVF